jgi:hypothetical protein
MLPGLTWNPPESVSMPRGQLMKLCSPPMSATRSLPAGWCTHKESHT